MIRFTFQQTLKGRNSNFQENCLTLSTFISIGPNIDARFNSDILFSVTKAATLLNKQIYHDAKVIWSISASLS